MPLKQIVDGLIYLLVRIFIAFIGVLPGFLAYPICESLAVLVFILDGKHRRIGLINLTIAFPEKDERWKKRVLRRSFQQLGDHVVELSRLHRLTPEKVRRRVQYEEGRGLENYFKAGGPDGPVLFLTAHISAWELLPAAHALHGHSLSFVVRPLDNPFLDRWVTRLRTQSGNQVITKQGSMRRILKTLQAGGDVGFLLDQNSQEKEGIYVPFFGRPASTNSSLAALSLKTSIPIVAGFIFPRSRRGRYTIRFYPPVEVGGSGDVQKDITIAMTNLNGCIEEMIREYPHCWLWGHRRFQTQPDGSNPYS